MMQMEKKDHVDTQSGMFDDVALHYRMYGLKNIILQLLPKGNLVLIAESIAGVQNKEAYVAYLNKRSGHLSSKVGSYSLMHLTMMVDQDHKANPLVTRAMTWDEAEHRIYMARTKNMQGSMDTFTGPDVLQYPFETVQKKLLELFAFDIDPNPIEKYDFPNNVFENKPYCAFV
ncbi:hypothetical protein Tco_0816415 [Tanacetum coccineum]